MDTRASLPKDVEPDLNRAVKILHEEGCAQIFVFGSAATGKLGINNVFLTVAKGVDGSVPSGAQSRRDLFLQMSRKTDSPGR